MVVRKRVECKSIQFLYLPRYHTYMIRLHNKIFQRNTYISFYFHILTGGFRNDIMQDWSNVLKSTVAFSPLSSQLRYSAGLRSRIPASHCRPWWTCLESFYRYLCKCWAIFSMIFFLHLFAILIELMELLNLYSDGRCELFLRWSQLWACVRLYSDCDLQDRTDHHSSGCCWQWINAACCKSLAYLPTFCSKHGILLKSHVNSEGHNLLQSLNKVLATYTFSTFAVVCGVQIHLTRSLLESLQSLDTHKSKF